MEQTPILTIYTPTYNRRDTLEKLYESLLRQSTYDFVFMVVDDGSTDDTKSLVESWKAPFCVEYVRKENGGVHTARDAAFHECRTELIVGIDSDDTVKPAFAEKILALWEEGDYIGEILTTESTDGTALNSPMPDIKSATFQDFNFGMKYSGEHVYVFKSEVIKAIPDAPVFPGEKLVPEGWKLIQLPDKPFLIMKDSLIVHEYLDSGYSKNIREVRKKNINGFASQYKMYSKKLKYFVPRILNFGKYLIACVWKVTGNKKSSS